MITMHHLPLCDCKQCQTKRGEVDQWKGSDNPTRYRHLIEPIDISRMHCPDCNKVSIWQDPANAEYLCTSCGIVISEQEILSKYHLTLKIKDKNDKR
jgi:hypothetical protein